MADEEVGLTDEMEMEVPARNVYVPSRGEAILAEEFRPHDCMTLPEALKTQGLEFKSANAFQAQRIYPPYHPNKWKLHESGFLRDALRNIISSDDPGNTAYRIGQLVKRGRATYVIADYYNGSAVLLRLCRNRVCRDNPQTIPVEDLRFYESQERAADLDYQRSRDLDEKKPPRKKKPKRDALVSENDDELNEEDDFVTGGLEDVDVDGPRGAKGSNTGEGASLALDQPETFRYIRLNTDELDLKDLRESLLSGGKITEQMSIKDMKKVADECIQGFIVGEEFARYVRLFMLSSPPQELRDLFGKDIGTVRKALANPRKTPDRTMDMALVVTEKRKPEPFFDMHAVPPLQGVDKPRIYAGDLMQPMLLIQKLLSSMQSTASEDPGEYLETLDKEIKKIDRELQQERRKLAGFIKNADIKAIEDRRKRFVALRDEVEKGGQVARKGTGKRHSWIRSTVEFIESDELHNHYIFGEKDRESKLGNFMPKIARSFYSIGKNPVFVLRSVELEGFLESYLLTAQKKDPNAFLDFEGKDIVLGRAMECSLGVEDQQRFLMDIYTKEYPTAVQELSEQLLNHLTIDSKPLVEVLASKGVEITTGSVIIPSWFYPQCGNDFRHIPCGLKIPNKPFGSVQLFLEKLMETCPYRLFFSAPLPSCFKDLVMSRPLCMFSEKPDKSHPLGRHKELIECCATAMDKRGR